MRFSWKRALIIARREYLTTVRRKAFLLTMIGMPAYFAFVMGISIKPQVSEHVDALRRLRTIAVVDSSGLFAGAPREVVSEVRVDPLNDPEKKESFRTEVVTYPDFTSAEAALRSGKVSQVLVVPADYLASGGARRYLLKGSIFASEVGQRPVERWLVRALLGQDVAPARAERAARPSAGMQVYIPGRDGRFRINDDRRETAEFLLPFFFAMLLGVCIVTSGQYLLQGVSEEKESRILESLICTVSASDLMVGKLIGLGGAGLTLVGVWTAAGAFFALPSLAVLDMHVSPLLLLLALAYFALGYLFYASLMTGIGAVTSNMREAQQFAFAFTFANFVPFIMLVMIMGHPDSAVAVGLSLFPPTAATTMLLRVTAPNAAVPAWQIALSLALLGTTGWFALGAAARVFRIGLLMYGKSPTLPEILRWARSRD